MSSDYYGNEVEIGDTVTKVGSSGEYVVTNILYGGDQVEIEGIEDISISQTVNTNNVIKIG